MLLNLSKIVLGKCSCLMEELCGKGSCRSDESWAFMKSEGPTPTVEAARHGKIQYLSNNLVISSFTAWDFKSGSERRVNTTTAPKWKQKSGRGLGVGETHKGEVTKSGFLARFPLEGEVWPSLCVWTAWEGTHTLPSDGRTSAWTAAKEPDARPGSQRWERSLRLVIQWYYLKPTTAAETRNASCPCNAAQTVRFPTAFGHTYWPLVARLGI